MLRMIAIGLAGSALFVLAAGCDDETTGAGGSTATPTGTAGMGGGGGTGGGGATGGSTSSGGSGNAGGNLPVNACEPDVESEAVCPAEGMRCTQTTGCCECMGIIGCGTETIWICVEPPGDAECPATAPSFEDTCTTEGQACEYCSSSNQIELWRCHGGIWIERMPVCTGPG